MIGLPELLVLGSAIVLIVNRKRIPKLFGEVGKSVSSFKEGLNEEETRPVRDVGELKDPSHPSKDGK